MRKLKIGDIVRCDNILGIEAMKLLTIGNYYTIEDFDIYGDIYIIDNRGNRNLFYVHDFGLSKFTERSETIDEILS